MKTTPHAKRRTRSVRPRPRPEGYLLKLFIAGMSARSVAAIRSIKRICDQHLGKDYHLEIVDLYRDPAQAEKEQIIALPTLVKSKPQPLRRIIGSMTDEARVKLGLDVKSK
jgi:circadian clock protein KaiB